MNTFISVDKVLGLLRREFRAGQATTIETISINMAAVERVEPYYRGSKIHFASGNAIVVTQTRSEVITRAFGEDV